MLHLPGWVPGYLVMVPLLLFMPLLFMPLLFMPLLLIPLLFVPWPLLVPLLLTRNRKQETRNKKQQDERTWQPCPRLPFQWEMHPSMEQPEEALPCCLQPCRRQPGCTDTLKMQTEQRISGFRLTNQGVRGIDSVSDLARHDGLRNSLCRKVIATSATDFPFRGTFCGCAVQRSGADAIFNTNWRCSHDKYDSEIPCLRVSSSDSRSAGLHFDGRKLFCCRIAKGKVVHIDTTTVSDSGFDKHVAEVAGDVRLRFSRGCLPVSRATTDNQCTSRRCRQSGYYDQEDICATMQRQVQKLVSIWQGRLSSGEDRQPQRKNSMPGFICYLWCLSHVKARASRAMIPQCPERNTDSMKPFCWRTSGQPQIRFPATECGHDRSRANAPAPQAKTRTNHQPDLHLYRFRRCCELQQNNGAVPTLAATVSRCASQRLLAIFAQQGLLTGPGQHCPIEQRTHCPRSPAQACPPAPDTAAQPGRNTS